VYRPEEAAGEEDEKTGIAVMTGNLGYDNGLLHTFQGRGQLEPGTRLMDVGLNEHNPLEALDILIRNEEAMSVTLHEITHFHSLDNSLGHVFTFLGYLTSSIGDIFRSPQTEQGNDQQLGQLQYYLGLRCEYALLLEAWRPVLEGLAVYVQTCSPCTELDEMVLPMATLAYLGAEVMALDPPASRDEPSHDDRLQAITSAAYKSMRAGPRLHVGNKTLAHALEFSEEKSWLPYSLGHAYVRALHDRLARASSHFGCPEHFVKIFLRILETSSARILESPVSWDKPERIESIYDWIEILEHAPVERIGALAKLEPHIDVLWFLQHGEAIDGYNPAAYDLAGNLARLVPDHWKMFEQNISATDLDEIAKEYGDSPLGLNQSEIAQRGVTGWIVGAGSLNLATEGDGELCGWIRGGFGTRHALAIRVKDSIWWLTLDDAELERFPIAIDTVPTLPADALEDPTYFEHFAGGCELKIDCFMAYLGYGLPKREFSEPGVRYPYLLLEFYQDDDERRSVLTYSVAGSAHMHRAVLQPVPEPSTQAMHEASEWMRQLRVSELGQLRLDTLAERFSEAGLTELAQLTWSALASEQASVARLRELWPRRVLAGLLGSSVSSHKKRAIISDRLRALIPEELRELVTLAYTTPCRIAEPERDQVLRLLEMVNQKAQSEIAKPLFQLNYDIPSFKYLGLWGKE
jgi:hypothetical protein